MKIINTSELNPSQKGLGLGLDSTQINDFLYNGLDSCLTVEILSVLLPQLGKETSRIYTFARGMQAPALEMMLRGIRVDLWKKSQLVTDFIRDLEKLDSLLQQYSHAIWGLPLNPNSPKQLIAFFYSHMKIPPVVISDKGNRRVSTNREALEKVKNYFYAKPVVNVILAMRDISKKLSTLRHGVDSDNRMRTSYNIVGTETGRWTSKESAFGTGDNLQNQTDRLRIIYIPDPGMKFAYCDLKQAESRGVGYISGCAPFIAACESSDLHTFVAKMVWPALEWRGDDKLDKKIAGKIFYRDFSYRDMSKRGGHGTNYRGTAYTMARYLKVETKVMEDFQRLYFSAFPDISRWHLNCARQLQLHGQLTTALGRRRFFFGRRDADETLRESIAYEPQSLIGDILNLGLYRVWASELCRSGKVQIIAQVHDAILVQYPEELENEIVPQILKLMEIEAPVNGRVMMIPTEASVGWNWQKFDADKNPSGIKEWTGNDTRKAPAAPTSILDRLIS